MPVRPKKEEAVVLLVDDEPEITAALRRLMEHLPWRVVEAHSAAEALEFVAREDVDVVLTDEQMPGMSGTSLLARIREIRPPTIRMILTGHASVSSALRAINEGEIRRYFLKPCDPALVIAELQVAVQERLRKRREEAEAETTEQEKVKRALERSHPGITRLKRDDSGAIDLDLGDEE